MDTLGLLLLAGIEVVFNRLKLDDGDVISLRCTKNTPIGQWVYFRNFENLYGVKWEVEFVEILINYLSFIRKEN